MAIPMLSKSSVLLRPKAILIETVIGTTATVIISVAKENVLPNASWQRKAPVAGDHIRVKRYGGVYCHHGIYVGNNKVVHFAPMSGSEVKDNHQSVVHETTLENFLRGGQLEVRCYSEEELKVKHSADRIVKDAYRCIGIKNYSFVFNNCEHFASWCVTGKAQSRQVEVVKTSLKPCFA